MDIYKYIIKTRQIILEMLELRDYNIDKYSNTTINELDIMFKNSTKTNEVDPLDMICKHNKNNKKIYVKYIILSKIRVGNLKSYIDEILINNIVDNNDEIIFIIKDKISNIALINNIIDIYLKQNNIFIQLYNVMDLTINITKHELVPKLKILNSKEKKEIVEKYNVEDMNQFPQFNRNDAQAKFYGVRSGDLCEITRISETSGFYKNYRYME